MSSIQTCKLVLVGNGSVGKTSIIRRFQADGFERQYHQTIGCDFFEKVLELKSGSNPVKVSVWDIGGQSLSSKNLPNYMAGASAVFICYDVTDPQSFADASDWVSQVNRSVSSSSSSSSKSKLPSLYLLGNKIDLIGNRLVSDKSHKEFISSHGLSGGFLVAASNGDNVLTAFYVVAAACASVQLSGSDLDFTRKVLSGTVAKETAGQRESTEEDTRAHQDILKRIQGGGGKDPTPCSCAVS